MLPSFNTFGGTSKKTLDLIKISSNLSYVYVYTNAIENEFKDEYIKAGAFVFQSNFERNIFKHIVTLLKVIDENKIQIIQTQFFFGELLAGIVKIFRPKVKLIVCFVGSKSQDIFRRTIQKMIYKKAEVFIYISKYVKKEKEEVFSQLKDAKTVIIYNGTSKLLVEKNLIKNEDKINILCVSGLSKIKNVQVLIDCMVILLNKNYKQVQFLIAGDGPEKESFEKQILEKKLEENIKLLGYQKNIGGLHSITNIFAHPCYIEGFGIAVAEAMLEKKPIIVSNAGALPELIINNETGFLVDAFDALEWAETIIKIINNPELANKIAEKAKSYAESNFSINRFVQDYNELYETLIN
jgi:glycosyltransferase involved in cell wall biosynthesis